MKISNFLHWAPNGLIYDDVSMDEHLSGIDWVPKLKVAFITEALKISKFIDASFSLSSPGF